MEIGKFPEEEAIMEKLGLGRQYGGHRMSADTGDTT